jgi:hypothetical protein
MVNGEWSMVKNDRLNMIQAMLRAALSLARDSLYYMRFCEKKLLFLNGRGNRQRQSAIGNRQSAIGNRQSAIGNRASR